MSLKSQRHADGDHPFNDEDYFVVMAELPTGQISQHYKMKHWSLFKIPTRSTSNEWDGHTTVDTHARIQSYIQGVPCQGMIGGNSGLHGRAQRLENFLVEYFADFRIQRFSIDKEGAKSRLGIKAYYENRILTLILNSDYPKVIWETSKRTSRDKGYGRNAQGKFIDLSTYEILREGNVEENIDEATKEDTEIGGKLLDLNELAAWLLVDKPLTIGIRSLDLARQKADLKFRGHSDAALKRVSVLHEKYIRFVPELKLSLIHLDGENVFDLTSVNRRGCQVRSLSLTNLGEDRWYFYLFNANNIECGGYIDDLDSGLDSLINYILFREELTDISSFSFEERGS